MRRRLFLLLSAILFVPALGGAQQANVNLDWNPQRNTEGLVPVGANLISPEVNPDRSVTFRVKALEASTVELVGAVLTGLGRAEDEAMPFTKGTDGVWTLQIGPLAPDMYAYRFRIDGATVADPNNTQAAFTSMPPYSQLIVPGDGPAYYDARNVPHGNITRHVYHSIVTEGERDLYVYTPPGYNRSITYPVLYLVGGSGELPHNWIHDGRVNFIMDNLLAEKKVVPMVIVVPNNQVLHRNHPRHVELTFQKFEAELRNVVIPLVEREYAVRRDAKGRALAGLSMGARHVMFVGLNSLDVFANFGVLSGGDMDSEQALAGFLNSPNVNAKIGTLFVGLGTRENHGPLGARSENLHQALLNHGIRHEYYVGGHGAHDWSTWRHLLHERFLPSLWRR